MTESDHEAVAGVLGVRASELRGLVAFFQNRLGEYRTAGRAECTLEAYKLLQRIAASAVTELAMLQRGIFAAYGTGSPVHIDDVLIDANRGVDITALLTAFLTNLTTMFEPYELDNLPPGNVGEEEFERACEQKTALAVPFHRVCQTVKKLQEELNSPMYRMDVSDEVREASWREEKKRQIIAFIAQCKSQIAEAEEGIRRVRPIMKQAIDDLKNIDQLPLFHEFKISPTLSDGGEADQPGPDTAAPSSGDQQSTKDGSEATGGT